MKPFALAIDDDPSFRKTMQVVLKSLGIDIEAVEKPDEFKKILLERKPAVVLIDLDLGEGLSGLTLVKEIRSKSKVTPAILVSSGNAKPQIISHALEMGANDYILKPFDKRVLANKLAQFVMTDEIDDQNKLIFTLNERRIPAKIQFSCRLLSVDELGVSILSTHLLPKGSVIDLSGAFVEELDESLSHCQVCVTRTALRPEHNLYEIYAEFEGADTNFLQSVRRWISLQKNPQT